MQQIRSHVIRRVESHIQSGHNPHKHLICKSPFLRLLLIRDDPWPTTVGSCIRCGPHIKNRVFQGPTGPSAAVPLAGQTPKLRQRLIFAGLKSSFVPGRGKLRTVRSPWRRGKGPKRIQSHYRIQLYRDLLICTRQEARPKPPVIP